MRASKGRPLVRVARARVVVKSLWSKIMLKEGNGAVGVDLEARSVNVAIRMSLTEVRVHKNAGVRRL